MIEPIALPGLTGKTVVVLDAGDAYGPAVCGSLIASGVIVIAVGAEAELPASLVDAGTGLDGELHYRALASHADWPAVAEWIGAHAERVHGFVGSAAAVSAAADALASRVAPGAAMVTVGPDSEPVLGARPGIRSNAVVLSGGRGSRSEDAGSAVAYLLSDLAELVDGARIPVGERPANAI